MSTSTQIAASTNKLAYAQAFSRSTLSHPADRSRRLAGLFRRARATR